MQVSQPAAAQSTAPVSVHRSIERAGTIPDRLYAAVVEAALARVPSRQTDEAWWAANSPQHDYAVAGEFDPTDLRIYTESAFSYHQRQIMEATAEPDDRDWTEYADWSGSLWAAKGGVE